MKKPKLNPEIFRNAAQMIENRGTKYGCHAIRRCFSCWRFIPTTESNPYEEYFAKWFKPEGKIRNEERYGWFGCGTVEANKQKRILALILCADILERQNKKK